MITPQLAARCRLLALFGHGAPPDVSPLCATKRTSADYSEFMGSRDGRKARENAGCLFGQAPKRGQRGRATRGPLTRTPRGEGKERASHRRRVLSATTRE